MSSNSDPDSLLDSAMADHQSGRVDLAESGYRKVLDIDPDQVDALNLLGLILQDKGDHNSAIEQGHRNRARLPGSPHQSREGQACDG